MKNATVLVCLLCTIWGVKAQNLIGVWFAGCNLRIDKNAGVDEYKIDSIYGVEGSILDFTSSDTFVIKSIGEEARQGTFEQIADTLLLTLDDFHWKGVFENEALALTLIDSSDYRLELFYKKLKPSRIPDHKMISGKDIKGTNWFASYEKGYAHVNFSSVMEEEFPDKPQAYFSNFYENNAITEAGNYQMDTYKGHLFLYLFGRATFLERVIHIGDYVSGNYSGKIFDCTGSMKEPIQFERAQWRQTKMLDEEGLIRQEAALSGRYQLKLVDTDDESSETVKSVIVYLDLNKDASCTVEAYLTENINEVAVLRKLDETGSWEMHASGHFIIINFEEEQEYFLTIQDNKGNLQLYLNNNPWPEEAQFDAILKFNKMK